MKKPLTLLLVCCLVFGMTVPVSAWNTMCDDDEEFYLHPSTEKL